MWESNIPLRPPHRDFHDQIGQANPVSFLSNEARLCPSLLRWFESEEIFLLITRAFLLGDPSAYLR